MYERYLYLVDEKYYDELERLVTAVAYDCIDEDDSKAAMEREQQLLRIEEIIATIDE